MQRSSRADILRKLAGLDILADKAETLIGCWNSDTNQSQKALAGGLKPRTCKGGYLMSLLITPARSSELTQAAARSFNGRARLLVEIAGGDDLHGIDYQFMRRDQAAGWLARRGGSASRRPFAG